MLRPATPLTVVLLIAFVLLLMSVITTPIVKSIPLGSFDGVNFGAMGYCQGDACSPIEVGYNTDPLFTKEESATFDLPSSTRKTLSSILIIHPIAAGFTLILLICAASSHCHSPSHSTRYLCVIFILGIVTFLLSLLAFLVDVLLFVPHLAAGTFMTLAAVILLAISGVVLCAMRRTLVGRKARKKRIDGNAEMNGDNFYARNGAMGAVPATAAISTEKPSFTTFAKIESDEKPLTARSPSEDTPGPVMSGAVGAAARGNTPPRAMGMGPPPRDHSAPPTFRAQDMRGRGGFPARGRGYGSPPPPPTFQGGFRGGFRGRGGGFAPPPRGRFPPRGMPPPRGMYGPMRGGYGPPPPMRMDGPPMPMRMDGRDGSAPPTFRSPMPGYAPDYNQYGQNQHFPTPPPQQATPPTFHQPAPQNYVPYTVSLDRVSTVPSAESPPPMPATELDNLSKPSIIGQAVEMDASTGSPSHPPMGFGSHLGGSDSDIHGMVNLQQQRQNSDLRASHTTGSHYSGEGFAPKRGYSPATGISTPLGESRRPSSTSRARVPSRTPSQDRYYEDVDPRFVETPPPHAQIPASASSSLLPQALNIGGMNARGPAPYEARNGTPAMGGMGGDGAYDLHALAGARSPAAESDGTDLTSISRRPVNPQFWGEPMPAPMRRPRPASSRREDILLNNNPDFSLPMGRGLPSSHARGMSKDGPYPGM